MPGKRRVEYLPTMPAQRLGITWRVAAAVGVAAILSVLVAGADRSGRRPPRHVSRHFRGHGSLPLSGDHGIAGTAFRQGFLAGIASAPDSLFDWVWVWTDNEGDPAQAHTFLSRDSGKFDALLIGLSTAASDLPTCPRACLVLSDGGRHLPDPRRWDLWTPSTVQQGLLLGLLRQGAPPRAVVLEATGAWVDPVIPGLTDSLPGLQVILHDPGNTRWDDAVAQILGMRARTILFWDSPADASALLSRRLAWPAFRLAKVWVPDGTSIPAGIRADTLRPVWQAIEGASDNFWRGWGHRCGRALAQSSRHRVLDSLPDWIPAFAAVGSDSTLNAGCSGWYPPWD